MATKSAASLALLLTFNLLFFTFTNACGYGCPTPSGGGSSGGSSGGGGSSSSSSGSCPTDALKFGVCADVLNIIKGVKIGTPPTTKCCSLLKGLVNLEAAVCLCTAIKGNILGINLNLPVDLSLILNYCGKGTPSGFKCA
jgi:Hydrophobic seed protein